MRTGPPRTFLFTVVPGVGQTQVQSFPRPPSTSLPSPIPSRTRPLSCVSEGGLKGCHGGGRGAHECPQLTEEEQGHYCHLTKIDCWLFPFQFEAGQRAMPRGTDSVKAEKFILGERGLLFLNSKGFLRAPDFQRPRGRDLNGKIGTLTSPSIRIQQSRKFPDVQYETVLFIVS